VGIGAALCLLLALVVLGAQSSFRLALASAIGWYLIVESPLRPAVAIVVLTGSPTRPPVAAQLYQAGWAPLVLLHSEAEEERAESTAVSQGAVASNLESDRQALSENGVPASAVRITTGEASDTLQELCLAARALEPGDNAVILVTSSYHSRRTLLVWQYVSGGRSPGVVRVAWMDSFDPDVWWRSEGWTGYVVHEYLGLLKLFLYSLLHLPAC